MIRKKRPADERVGGGAAKLSRRRRRHLYLVLDDWEKGYSIRKLDLSSLDSDSGDIEQRLPPAVFRLEAPRADSGLFTTFGTKIIAAHHTRRRSIPMWDVCTRALTFAPRHTMEPSVHGNGYVEIDGHLILLTPFLFESLAPPPPTPDDELGSIKVVWDWESLPKPPFDHPVVSHAVHPDGRTILYTAEKPTPKRNKVVTFSFHTPSGKWTRHGKWRLPFRNRGYFVPELDAWVGLSYAPDTLGHLCACDVVSALDGQVQPPAWKLSKDKLFCVDPAEKHVGATLVYLGAKSEFCLVQCFSTDYREENIWKNLLLERPRYMLRVTTFSLKYDTHGDLRTSVHRRVRSYPLPKIATWYNDHLEKPVAFWL